VIRRVALVSTVHPDRAALAKYLRDSGFAVHECEELAIAAGFGSLVYLGHDVGETELRRRVRGWMRARTRVVVVTGQPTALDELQITYGKRLVVFVPPVFGWHVVDALRASEPPRPRSA
jgi:hypothetical protein